MFRREIINELTVWSNQTDRKPLILKGARQVGKTTAINLFSKQFDQYIYLNLERDKDKIFFQRYNEIEDIIDAIFIAKQKIRKNKKTLIFIDEIQEESQAIQQLRYFYEEAKDLYVVAAGSLLEVAITPKISTPFPVGRVQYKVLRPVSFIEFLQASNNHEALFQLQKVPIARYAHYTLLKLFHTYTLIGGMPNIIDSYCKNNEITQLAEIYDNLLSSYIDDIEKYARNQSIAHVIRFAIRSIFKEAGNRIKFQGFGKSEYRSREMAEALRTLEKAWLIHLIYPTTKTELPLMQDYKKAPRLQILDTGLINYFSGIQTEIIGTENLSSAYRGIIAEHIVGQELLASKHLVLDPLHFWVREKKGTMAELDYLYSYKGKIIPIEVKSGTTGKLKSLHLFMDQVPLSFAIRFYSGEFRTDKARTPAGKIYNLYSLPYYLVSQIDRYLDWIFEKETTTPDYSLDTKQESTLHIIEEKKYPYIKNDIVNTNFDTLKVLINDTVKTNTKITQRFIKILYLLNNTPGLRSNEIAKRMHVSEITIRRDMQKIKELVTFQGAPKNGGYYLTMKGKNIINK